MNENILFEAIGYMDDALVEECIRMKQGFDAFRRAARVSRVRKLSLISAYAALVLVFCMPWAVKQIDLLTRDWPEFEPPKMIETPQTGNNMYSPVSYAVSRFPFDKGKMMIYVEFEKIEFAYSTTNTEYKHEYVSTIVDGIRIDKLVPTDEVLSVTTLEYLLVSFSVINDSFNSIEPNTIISVPIVSKVPEEKMVDFFEKRTKFLIYTSIEREEKTFELDDGDISLKNVTHQINVAWPYIFPVKNGRIELEKIQELAKGHGGYGASKSLQGIEDIIWDEMPVDIAMRNFNAFYEWRKDNPWIVGYYKK